MSDLYISDLYIPKSAVVVVAHPDDIEYSCAGTLTLWARGGTHLVFVLCTSGESGINRPGVDREKAIEIREAEQRAAAEVIGAAEVVFLRQPDGLLQPTLALRKELVRIIRRVRPEVVLSGDPNLIYINDFTLNHPDHRAASLATLEAAWPAAGQANLYPDMDADESLCLHRPKKLFSTGWIQPGANLFVDIESVFDVKLEALRNHKSQMHNFELEQQMLRYQATANAEGQEMKLAECFRVTTLVPEEWWDRSQGDPRVPSKLESEQ